MYGISLSFVATRSGLTRFEDHRTEEEKNATSGGTDQQEETTFGDVYNRATDELFYQRAVDFYRFNASAFVFSVPFDAGSKEDKYIIGSHALFFGSGTKKAPAAVAGIVFKHKMFTERFFNFSTMCMKSNCKLNCSSPKTDCFLLDNNGYVIVSETNTDTGRFFGEIDWKMFDTMVGIGVYKEIQMFDYQAICRQAVKESSPASILRTPFRTIGNFLLWLWFKITLISVDFYLKTIALLDGTSGEYHIGYDPSSGLYPDEEKVTNLPPNKTRPYPCDKKFNLYEMERLSGEDPKTGYYPKCDICDERYILQPVPYTNLILLVLQAECPCAAQTHKIVPQEIMYEGDCAIERHHIDRIRAQPNVTCRNHHPEEPELKACGKGIRTVPSKCRTWLWILLSALINTLMLHCISISHSA